MRDVAETVPGAVQPFAMYITCHRSGPSFQGPTNGGVLWKDGVAQPVEGFRVRRFGLFQIGQLFEVVEGYAPVWENGAWYYRAAPPPVAKAPKPKPAPKRKQSKRKRS